MTKLSLLLGDYPHTRPLKDRAVPVEGVEPEFVDAVPLAPKFPRMVRDLEFDVCEMALATYFQAREAEVPVTLLPVAMIGNTHHQSLTRLPGAEPIAPRDLVGRRVGVRAYSQTTGLWVRGVLREEYEVEARDVTWVTTEEPHVEQYRDPAWVERSVSAGTVKDLLRSGDVAAACLGPRAIGAQGIPLVPLVEDAKAAGQAWAERHGTVPVNHLVVVRDDLIESNPDAVRAVYRALRDAIAATAAERDDSPSGRVVSAGWSDPLVKALEIGARYALEQEVVRTPLDLDGIVGEASFLDA